MSIPTHRPAAIPQRVLDQLARIFAPVQVGVPPVNAFHDMVMLPGGQIRHYGFRGSEQNAQRLYIASDDCGLSWQEYPTPPDSVGACVRSPWSGDWLTIIGKHECPDEHDPRSILRNVDKGLYLCRSTQGIDGPFTLTQITDQKFWVPRQPMALRHRKRWIFPCQFDHQGQGTSPALFWSDDDGETWNPVVLEIGPLHKIEWPHQGVRWQNYGCEPTITELSDGRLWMLIRTSTDTHYESFSDDAGQTWTRPCPSRFYGTITMPTFFRMSDGRLLLFWCNTTPLPELDHSKQAELLDWEREGKGEDFFTNRDVFHAAISEDDGASWIGFREISLNPIRNDADYRTSGGNDATLDKSMHQSQAVELPGGKILVSHGQHPRCRRLMIFDPAWLYETERRDDFHFGLGDWCTFQYLHSIAGNFRGVSGHCAYNRRPGALLVPSPDGEPREVLHIACIPDPHLLHQPQGAVWNFPAGLGGELRIGLRLAAGTAGVRICLMDRWFNPVDPVAHHFACYALDATPASASALTLAPDRWHELVIRWTDSRKTDAVCLVEGADGAPLTLALQSPSVNGPCYLHLQSLATRTDPAGVLIRYVAADVSRDVR